MLSLECPWDEQGGVEQAGRGDVFRVGVKKAEEEDLGLIHWRMVRTLPVDETPVGRALERDGTLENTSICAASLNVRHGRRPTGRRSQGQHGIQLWGHSSQRKVSTISKSTERTLRVRMEDIPLDFISKTS